MAQSRQVTRNSISTDAFQFHEIGGPEVLLLQQVKVGPVGPGEVRLRQTAIGVNFVDTYYRRGTYKAPLPSGIGFEAAGIIEELGDGVSTLRVGDQVSYATPRLGAYARDRIVPADCLVVLPEDITARLAAAVMLQGLTAQYLLQRVYRVQPGETILVHAAAGGVGLILCQWAAHLGATVIGTVGTVEKANLAAEHGCHYPIVYRPESLVEQVLQITGGAKLPVVYDSIGANTFSQSLDCLRPFGLLVSFGQSSGVVPPLDPRLLAEKGSLYLTRPTLWTYIAQRPDLLSAATELFQVIRDGVLKVNIFESMPLKDAIEAHHLLESRKTKGKIILNP